MMKERERERKETFPPPFPSTRVKDGRTVFWGFKGPATGTHRCSARLFIFFLSLSLSALYNIACVYIYIPTFVGRRKICEKKGKAAHTNTEEKKKEREREKEKKIEFRLNTSSTMSFQPWSGSFFLFLKE